MCAAQKHSRFALLAVVPTLRPHRVPRVHAGSSNMAKAEPGLSRTPSVKVRLRITPPQQPPLSSREQPHAQHPRAAQQQQLQQQQAPNPQQPIKQEQHVSPQPPPALQQREQQPLAQQQQQQVNRAHQPPQQPAQQPPAHQQQQLQVVQQQPPDQPLQNQRLQAPPLSPTAMSPAVSADGDGGGGDDDDAPDVARASPSNSPPTDSALAQARAGRTVLQ